MRGLLCGTQSSKEQLRRSRTESSGAAPAIEELAGEARQVRPAGPRADQYQPTLFFSRAGRSGGRPALLLPRASNPRRSSAYRLRPDCAPQKRGSPSPVPSSPIRRGLEGDRPSCSHDQHSRAAACISPPLPAAHHRSRDTSTRYRARPAASSPQTRHFSVIFPEVTEESVISAKKTADSRDSSVAPDRIRRNADSVKVTTPLPVLTMRLLRPRHFDELLKWPHGISLHAGSLGTPTLPS